MELNKKNSIKLPQNYFQPSRSNVFCVPKICKLWFPVPLVLLLKWVLNKISQTVLPRLWVIRLLYFSNFLSRWRQRGKESRASIRCLTARRRRPGLTVVSPFRHQLFSSFEPCLIPLVLFLLRLRSGSLQTGQNFKVDFCSLERG